MCIVSESCIDVQTFLMVSLSSETCGEREVSAFCRESEDVKKLVRIYDTGLKYAT